MLASPAFAEYNGLEQQTYSNISATTAAFTLRGGQYGVTVHAGHGVAGASRCNGLAADNSTYVTCLTAFTADGYASVNLPGGTYKFTVATATGIYVDLTGIMTVH